MKTLKEILEGRNIGNFTFNYDVPEGSTKEMFDLLKAEIIDPKKYRKTNGAEWSQIIRISREAQSFFNMLSEIGHPIESGDEFINLSIQKKYNSWEDETKWIWSFRVGSGLKIIIESPANEKLTIQSFIKKHVEPKLKDFATFKDFASDKNNLK